MTRDGVAGSGSSMVMPKPLRNASIVRIAPSIQNDATSLIADIGDNLRVLRISPSRPYRDLLRARATIGYFVSINDRVTHRVVKLARVIFVGLGFDHRGAQLLTEPADIGPHLRDFGPGRKSDRGPQCVEPRSCDRGVESLPSEHHFYRAAEHLSYGFVGEQPVVRHLG